MIQQATLQRISGSITPTLKADKVELSKLKEGQVIPRNGSIIATSCVRHEQWAMLDYLLRRAPRTITVILSPENQNFLNNTNVGNSIKRHSKEIMISNEGNGLNPVA